MIRRLGSSLFEESVVMADYSAAEAAEKLGVTRATLYSYVSRGLVRSFEEEGRRRRYSAQDVEALLQRKQRRKEPERLIRQALHWGTPLVDSSLSHVDRGMLHYKGVPLTEALDWSFEEAVGFLWGEWPSVEGCGLRVDLNEPLQQRMVRLLNEAQALDPSAQDLRRPAVLRCGAKIVALLFTAVSGSSEGPLVERLKHCWPEGGKFVHHALICCLDHELNISSFTARCVASSGADPYAVVMAALCAFSGFRHGHSVRRVQNFFQRLEGCSVTRLVEEYWACGRQVPGFGHPLYPEGDPRGRLLLKLIDDPVVSEVVEVGRRLLQDEPNLDLALGAAQYAFGWPEEAAYAIFALGRSGGWIAHALEQLEDGRLIRPRAHYVGPRPRGDRGGG